MKVENALTVFVLPWHNKPNYCLDPNNRILSSHATVHLRAEKKLASPRTKTLASKENKIFKPYQRFPSQGHVKKKKKKNGLP